MISQSRNQERLLPGNHATANSAFLSAAQAKMTEGTDYYSAPRSIRSPRSRFGKDDALPSLELAMDLLTTVGKCDNGYACVYQNNLSWSSPTTPLPAEAHPRVVFERLFGDGGSSADRMAELRRNASLLDWVTRRYRAPAEEARARRPHRRSANIWTPCAKWSAAFRRPKRRPPIPRCPISTAPSACRPSYADHARLMFDLQVLALQGDVTRVITFQLARETSTRTYPEIGVPDPHHPLIAPRQRSGEDREAGEDQRVSRLAVRLFLEKLKATPEGDGNAARSFALSLRQRHGQSRRARPRRICRSWWPAARPAG